MQVWEDEGCIYLFMEACRGGELFDVIIQRGHFSEHDAATVSRVILQVRPVEGQHSGVTLQCKRSNTVHFHCLALQLPQRLTATVLQVVEHCHSQGVIHRDLKPENFLLKRRGAPSVALSPENLRAADFGLAAFTSTGRKPHFTSLVGSAFYVAPEVLKGSYGAEADFWSCGVILYILLRRALLPPSTRRLQS